jgi:Fe-S cluster biosynthesis and repair protein YggX
MDLNDRISRFEALVAEDPTNDMAYFSLGGAYNQGGFYDKAATAYLRCTELNPSMSKAYQLAGAALMASQDLGRAGEVLTEGYAVAAERGDLMPQKAMGELLAKIGLPVPAVARQQVAPAATDSGFICRKTGKPGTRMVRPPYRGPIGAWLAEHISQETFAEGWLPTGTKVINELRLDLTRDADSAVYDHAMRAYFAIDSKLYRELTGQEPPQIDGQTREMVQRMFGDPDEVAQFKGGLKEIVEHGH